MQQQLSTLGVFMYSAYEPINVSSIKQESKAKKSSLVKSDVSHDESWKQISEKINTTLQKQGIESTVTDSPIFQCQYYQTFKSQLKGQKILIKIFDKNELKALGLQETIQTNRHLLKNISQLAHPKHFHQIDYVQLSENKLMFIFKKYQHRLDQFLATTPLLDEPQILDIFNQIVKVVASLNQKNITCQQIRTQHFVYAKGQWKMSSLVTLAKQFDKFEESEYTLRTEYYSPEAYDRKQFTEQELKERVVWYLGCILAEMMLGVHYLKNRQTLDLFKNDKFTLEAIQIPSFTINAFSPGLRNVLGEMCHYSYEKRLKLADLISPENIPFEKMIEKYAKKRSVSSSIYSSESSSPYFKGYKTDKKYNNPQITINIKSVMQNNKGSNIKEVAHKSEVITKNQAGKSQIQLNQKKMNSYEQSQIYIILDKTLVRVSQHARNPEIHQKMREVFATLLTKCGSLSLEQNQYRFIEQALDERPILDVNFYRLTETYFARQQQLYNSLYIAGARFLLDFASCLFLLDLHEERFYDKILKTYKNNPQFTREEFYYFKNDKTTYPQFNHLAAGMMQARYVRLQNTSVEIRDILKDLQNVKKTNNSDYRQAKDEVQAELSHLISLNMEDILIKKDGSMRFKDIKKLYRKVLFMFYHEAVRKFVETNKNIVYAQLTSKLTYLLAIDKMYLPDGLTDNFSIITESLGINAVKYLVLPETITKFFNAESLKGLRKFSKYILKKYFDLEKGREK